MSDRKEKEMLKRPIFQKLCAEKKTGYQNRIQTPDGLTYWQMDGRTEGRKDGRTDVWKFTPVFYRTSALWGRCPALNPLSQQIIPSRARVSLTICYPWITSSMPLAQTEIFFFIFGMEWCFHMSRLLRLSYLRLV